MLPECIEALPHIAINNLEFYENLLVSYLER